MIASRSNSAMAPRTLRNRRPDGVVESMASATLAKRTRQSSRSPTRGAQVSHGAAPAIQLGHDDGIQLAAGGPHELVELRPGGPGARNSLLAVHGDDGPTLGDAIGLAAADLVVEARAALDLLVGADPGVDGGPHRAPRPGWAHEQWSSGSASPSGAATGPFSAVNTGRPHAALDGANNTSASHRQRSPAATSSARTQVTDATRTPYTSAPVRSRSVPALTDTYGSRNTPALTSPGHRPGRRGPQERHRQHVVAA